MTWLAIHRHLKHGVVLPIGFVAAIACYNKDASRSGSESTAARNEVGASGTARGTVAATAGPGVRRDPPEMVKDFDHTSAADFQAYLVALDHDPGYKPELPTARKCTHNSTLCPSGTDAQVSISPVRGIRHLGTKSNASIQLTGTQSNNYVIARIVNTSTDLTEAWLNLPPGDSAFWLLEPDAKGNAVSRIVQLEKAKDGTLVISTLKKDLLYYACDHGDRDDDDAAFADCSYATSGYHPASAEDVTSTWASCPGGCCATSSGKGPFGDTTKKPPPRPATKRPGV